MPNTIVKKKIFAFCEDFIQDRLHRIQSQIQEMQAALTSETKSSAGDKHEIGRAMIQLEREKLGQQLAEAEKIGQLLTKIDISNTSSCVGLGSLIKTDGFNYFIAISAGEFKDSSEKVYCISAATPIAKLLLGKSVNDMVVFNGKQINITEIL